MSANCRKGLMISRGYIILIMTAISLAMPSYARAQAANPPVNIDQLCNESRARANQAKAQGNKMYQQSAVDEQCAAIRAAHETGRMARAQGNWKIPVVGVCLAAAVMCSVPIVGQAVGQGFAIGCGALGLASSIGQQVADNNLAKDLGEESKAFDYVGATQGAAGLASSTQAILAPKSANKSGKACWMMYTSAALQAAEMTMHYMTSNELGNQERNLRNGFQNLAGMGGSMDNQRFQMDKDNDSMFKDEVPLVPPFDEEQLAQIENLTGMKPEEFTHFNGNPNDLIQSLLEKAGVPEDKISEGLAQLQNAMGPESQALYASLGKNASTQSTGGSDWSNGPTSDFIGSRSPSSAQSGKLGEVAYRDPASMTAEELEKDKFHDIFLRVKRRYEQKAPENLEVLPWVSKANLFANVKSKAAKSNEKLRFK